MKKRDLLLWLFLQLGVALAIAQTNNTSVRISSLKVQTADLSLIPQLRESLRTLQKQALTLNFPKNMKNYSGSEGKKIYGFLEFDETITDKGIVEFSLDHLENLSFLYKTQNFTICAGAYANDRYYYYAYAVVYEHTLPLGFYEMDLESGESKMIKDYSSMSMLYGDMTYDYLTNTMWAYSVSDDGPVLLSVDLETGEYTTLAVLQETLLALAADGNGLLYGIAGNGSLYSINKVTGGMSLIGKTGISPKYLQTMEFDRSSNVLYWAASTSDDKGIIARVDTKTGRAENLGTVGDNSQLLGLYIPYIPSGVKAPEAPADLSITTDGNVNKVLLEWKNPSEDVAGNSLKKLESIKIYRGKELLTTLKSPIVGGEDSYEDTGVPHGLMVYTVTATNEAGESSGATAQKFVGRDIPGAPGSFKATKLSQNAVRLTWEAPTVGFNGGWLDTSTLTYKITRYPDNKVLAESASGNQIEDNHITEYNNYYYLIQAFNEDGEGDMAVSEQIGLGNPYLIPYMCPFATQAEFNKWWVIDRNQDEVTWTFYQEAAMYKTNFYNENAGDDWLISPPLQLEKGKAYKMSFNVFTGGYTEKLSVTFGKESTVESQSVVLDENSYSSTDTIRRTVYLPENIDNDNYRIAFHAHSDAYQFFVSVNDIVVEESDAGQIKGDITYNASPVEGCEVRVKETGVRSLTDVDGNYRILNVEAGTYTLVITKTGYEVQDKKVTVQKKTATEINSVLIPLPRYAVTGKLVDTAGKPQANVPIRISGYADFETITEPDGTFTIADVFKADSYMLSVQEDRYYYYSQTFSVTDRPVSLGKSMLTERVLPPYGIIVKEENKNQLITWEKPAGVTDFRYDDGKVTDQLMGFYDGNEKSVCGTIHRIPTLLNRASWYLTSKGEPNRGKVNLYIFDLDERGEPTSRIIYSKKEISTRLDEWSDYYFEKEVYAPNGYMVAVSVDNGYLSVGYDSGKSDEYPFEEHAQCMTYDYSEGYTYLTTLDTYNKNLMIRASGFPTGGVESTKPADAGKAYSYKIWRFMEGEQDNENSWSLLSTEPLTETNRTDTSWGNLAQGIYRYAVKSVSQNGTISVPSFSEVVYKEMFTAVTVRVNTTTDGKNADGAIVTIYNDENQYSDTIRQDNRLLFVKVWKGNYSLKIVMPGYSNLVKGQIDFSKENRYVTEVYTLQEIVESPYNISIENTGIGTERLLKWDIGLFDNFELHTDFTINSPGLLGWTYIDGDESLTDGSSIFDFPGMGEKMAYVVMNCKETVEGDTTAWSGNKYMAAFCAQSGHNNDLIISPELKAEKDFKISFYARSYEGAFGLETFRVGYSTTGAYRIEDFKWIDGSKQDVPVAWTRYEFMVPAAARYVTINCISTGQYILMLDDIFIDAEVVEPSIEYYSYEVYLNDKLVKQSREHSFLLQNLAKGDYKASVRRVYSSGSSDLKEVNFTVTDGQSIENVENGIEVYPNPVVGSFFIKGEYTRAQVIDNTGKILIDADHSCDCIQVGTLPEGFYVVKIAHSNGVTLRKILVKK